MRLKTFLLFSLVFLMMPWLPSCKKSDSTKPNPAIVNTWNFQGQTITVGYSDIITKKGFTLIFHPEASTHSNQELQFIFPSHPVGEQSFSPSADTSNAQAVMVHLLTDQGGYHSADGDTAKVRTSIFNNKVYLTGFNLNLQSDSVTGGKSPLSFNLTEF
ncbi:MAG: hypothetical protein ABI378_14020 [Chitinophagaceae bacterium]